MFVYIVDTAGQSEYSSIREQCSKIADIVILGFAINERSTFEEISAFYNEVKRVSEKKPAFIGVGNKLDLANHRKVSTEEAQAFFENFNPPIPYFEISAETGQGVNALFEEATRLWYKMHLEEMAAREERQRRAAKKGGCKQQ